MAEDSSCPWRTKCASSWGGQRGSTVQHIQAKDDLVGNGGLLGSERTILFAGDHGDSLRTGVFDEGVVRRRAAPQIIRPHGQVLLCQLAIGVHGEFLPRSVVQRTEGQTRRLPLAVLLLPLADSALHQRIQRRLLMLGDEAGRQGGQHRTVDTWREVNNGSALAGLRVCDLLLCAGQPADGRCTCLKCGKLPGQRFA